MDKIELFERTRIFAVGVFKMVNRFPESQAAKVIAYQILKSSSSVAANYRAVNRAKSGSDFTNKMKIVLEEADESNFWLNFIKDVAILPESDSQLTDLIKESNELTAIFSASVKTLSNKPKEKSKNLKS